MSASGGIERHRKIVIERSPMGLRDYADHYRFGGDGQAPLVHYTGGAISRRQHAERFDTEPSPIVAEFRRALPAGLRVDLLVSPSPPAGDVPRDEPLDSYLEHVVDVLLPAAGLAPGTIGFVGYSHGAHLATYLAASDGRARALGLFGAVGIIAAARAAAAVVPPSLVTRLYRNVDDQVPDPRTYVAQLPAALGASVAAQRRGAHAFKDYAANGTVRDVFAFVLGSLQ